MFPHILISALGLHVQRTNPQPEMKEPFPSGSDYAFSSLFSIFSPRCSSAVILSLVGSALLACSGSGSPPPPSVIQDWHYLRAPIHTLTHCSPFQKQILDGDLFAKICFVKENEDRFAKTVLF